eukprot:TRINITY_DN29039_c0_g2_i1.p1 TRINITY_DN29039_c0_g2~~TRINITY_DN29039_c0_g2_i1.p1  ORF type:complete len:286 (+),score=30.08 TRINITY_DN29039_c0_g2_i1:24-860(+)
MKIIYMMEIAIVLLGLVMGSLGEIELPQEAEAGSPMQIILFECEKGQAIKYSNLKNVREFTLQFFIKPTIGKQCGKQDLESVLELSKGFSLFFDKKELFYSGFFEESKKSILPYESRGISEFAEWIHWAFQIKNNRLKIWINGKPVVFESKLRFKKVPNFISFGSSHDKISSSFSGELGDIRIWKRPLSSKKISETLQKSLQGFSDKESISIIEMSMLLFLEQSEILFCIHSEVFNEKCNKIIARIFQIAKTAEIFYNHKLQGRRLAGCHSTCPCTLR